MEFFDTVQARRSIRRFKSEKVPAAVIERALEAAVLAPNSSNMQTWDFYWATRPETHEKLVKACLSQSAARTASDLIVVVADPKLWRRSNPQMIRFLEGVDAPKMVHAYYKKLIPFTYRWGFLNWMAPAKWIITTAVGLFRPMARGPHTRRDVQEVAIKSAALASENFVLAIAAQGYATCMMEGFDEVRVKQCLGLGLFSSARVVMVIGVGAEAEKGTWGPRFRIPSESVIHKV